MTDQTTEDAMSDVDVAALKEAAEKATLGPWEWEPPSDDSWPQGDESLVTGYVPGGEQCRQPVLYGWGYDASGINATDEDRAYIAAANPTTVLALIERMEAAEAAVERVLTLAEGPSARVLFTDIRAAVDGAR